MEKKEKISEEMMDQKEKDLEETVSSSQDVSEEVRLLQDHLLRTMAELENVRKRTEREKEDIRKYAISGFSRDLLAVMDNLERALSSKEQQINQDDVQASLKVVLEGIELTRQEMSKVFGKYQIKKIGDKGVKFNHDLHQVVLEVEAQDVVQGTIVDVLQAGYLIEDRLLRPAMVTVAKG